MGPFYGAREVFTKAAVAVFQNAKDGADNRNAEKKRNYTDKFNKAKASNTLTVGQQTVTKMGLYCGGDLPERLEGSEQRAAAEATGKASLKCLKEVLASARQVRVFARCIGYRSKSLIPMFLRWCSWRRRATSWQKTPWPSS